jgi:hypothetical protein
MRHVREILRLKYGADMSTREIARRVGVAPSTVRTTLERFAGCGLGWPPPDDVTDSLLEERLFRGSGSKQGHRSHAEPDWVALHREMKRKHVTLLVLSVGGIRRPAPRWVSVLAVL